MVPEIALDLALDGRAGEVGQDRIELRTPPLDRLAQPEPGELSQVVVLDPTPVEPAGDPIGIRPETLHHRRFTLPQSGTVVPDSGLGQAFETTAPFDRLGIENGERGNGIRTEFNQGSHGENPSSTGNLAGIWLSRTFIILGRGRDCKFSQPPSVAA